MAKRSVKVAILVEDEEDMVVRNEKRRGVVVVVKKRGEMGRNCRATKRLANRSLLLGWPFLTQAEFVNFAQVALEFKQAS